MDPRQLRDALFTIEKGRKSIEEMIGIKGRTVLEGKVLEALVQLNCQLEIQQRSIHQLGESNLRIDEIISRLEENSSASVGRDSISSLIFPHKFFSERRMEDRVEEEGDELTTNLNNLLELGNKSDIETDEIQSSVNIPAEVLEGIFKKLSNEELLLLRPVCKSWNEEICRSVMINLRRIQKDDGFPCFSPSKCQELYNFLKESTYPGVLIKEVRVSSDMNCPSDMPPHNNPFQKFGTYVKRLKIVKDVDLSILSEFLAQEDALCPNIEILDYFSPGSENPFSLSLFQNQLQLKKLRFESPKDASVPDQVALFNCILKNSPQLTSLHLQTNNSEALIGFFKIMQTLPILTSSLNKLCITTNNFSKLEELVKCKFSNKLKSLKYQFFYSLAELELLEGNDEDSFPNYDLVNLLAESLQRFEIEVRCFEIDVFNMGLTNFSSLRDTKLEVLSIKNVKLYSLDVVKKVPSLRVLNIYDFDDDENADEKVKLLAQSQFVHNSLEHINFQEESGNFIKFSKPSTFPLLNAVFPQLAEVHFVMDDFPFDYGLDEQREYFEQSFQAISQMRSLQVLEITLDKVKNSLGYPLLDLTKAFSYFKEIPKLERIIFYRTGSPLYNFPKKEWLMELVSAPKLRKVEFHGFTMGTKREYERQKLRFEKNKRQRYIQDLEDVWLQEAVTMLAANNISLEVRNLRMFF